MSLSSFRPRAGLRAALRLLLLLSAGACAAADAPVPSGKPPPFPDWWFQRSAIARLSSTNAAPLWPGDYPAADNYAALNQGQLKTFAVAAYDYLQDHIGAGGDVELLVRSWFQLNSSDPIPADPAVRIPKSTGVENYAVANLGQLKAVAKVFYDRLMEDGLCPGYPWIFSADLSDDSAVANLGQAKNMFRFVVDGGDSDDDGVPDWFAAAAGFDSDDASAEPADALPAGNGPDFQVVGPDETGPNGGVLPPDDLDHRTNWPPGVTLWTRHSYGERSKSIGFPRFFAEEFSESFYLQQREYYSATQGYVYLDEQGHVQQATIKASGSASMTIDPVKGTRSSAMVQRVTDSYHNNRRKYSITQNEFVRIALRNRPAFFWKYGFDGKGNFPWSGSFALPWTETRSILQQGSFQHGANDKLRWDGNDFSSPGDWVGTYADTVNGTTTNYDFYPNPQLLYSEDASAFMAFSNYAGLWDCGPSGLNLPPQIPDERTLQFRRDPLPADGDYPLSIRYTRVLGKPYTKKALVRDVKAYQPDYDIEWVQQSLGDGTELASWEMDDDEIGAVNYKLAYKFHVKEQELAFLSWLEIFVPAAAGAPKKFVHRTWSRTPDTNDAESPVWEIDPAIRGEKGSYFIAPIEIAELAPPITDEDGNLAPNSDKPSQNLPLTPLIEVDPVQNRIAYRELKVKIGNGELNGKKVTWSLAPVPNATPAVFRGRWQDSTIHPDRFEASATFGSYQFRRMSTDEGESKIDAQGYTAIRVNVPPIAYNKPRIRIQIEGSPTSADLIDMEVPAIVVIDPGHGGVGPRIGGSDPNHAISSSGVLEKTMTLDFGILLRSRLQTLRTRDRLNLRIYMTRDADVNYTLEARANRARDVGADVFISLHFNGNNKITRGTETWYRRSGSNVNLSEDSALANRVQTAVFGAMQRQDPNSKDRRAKSDIELGSNGPLGAYSDTYLGNSTDYHPIRGILLETEFIDVPAVDQLLNTGANHQQVRQVIADALGDALQDDLLHNP